MANDQWTVSGGEWTDRAADAARTAAERREVGGSSDVPPGGPGLPEEVTIPGRPEHEVRTPGREASPDVGVPHPGVEPQVPGHEPAPPQPPRQGGAGAPRREPAHDLDLPDRSASAEDVPELLGERSDYPIPFGEDPGDLLDPDR